MVDGHLASIVTDSWSNGFVANVTVANTGNSAVNGWALGFTLPAGQAITNSWNATLTGNSGAVIAPPVVDCKTDLPRD